MNNHEQAFVSSFVIPEKRVRYAEFLARPKRRGEIISRFNHFFDFVPELATQVPRGSAEELATLLRRHGAPKQAYLIGRPSELDGCELPLFEAVDCALNDGWGTVISCLPGRLALYLQEFPPGKVFILVTRHDP